MPPLSRNHRVPTAGDTPATTPASSLDTPSAIASQNRCRCSCRATGGRPGDRIAGLPVAAAAHPLGRPIHTLLIEVLRRPLESTQYTSVRFAERLADAGISASVGSVGDSFDHALAETINGLHKTEVIKHRGPWRTVDHVEYATAEWVDWFRVRLLTTAVIPHPSGPQPVRTN